MLRDQNLVPLSHQHHDALALCVRIERSLAPEHAGRWPRADSQELQQEIERQFQNAIQYHFDAEEQVLFPAAAEVHALKPLVNELLAEHARLREYRARAAARQLSTGELQEFARLLSLHVRKEEQQLFEGLQQALSPEKMSQVGAALAAWFENSGMPGASCSVP